MGPTALGGRQKRFATALAVLALTVPALAACGDDESSTTEDTSVPVELPEPQPAQAENAIDFLEGEGAPLLRLHAVATGLGSEPSAADCETATEAAKSAASPASALELAAGVPDEPLRTVLIEERNALGTVLGLCAETGSPEELAEAVTQLVTAAGLVDQRLAELKAG